MFPQTRLRRLRKSDNLRRLVRETQLSVDNLVMPYFVCEGKDIKNPVSSMPRVFQLSVDNLLRELKDLTSLNIPAVILFGIPKKKDALGSGAYDKNGIIQRAARTIKDKFQELVVITDICLCEYTEHGHCGILQPQRRKISLPDGKAGVKAQKNFVIDNDETLKILSKIALSHAQAGADVVAPSAMMDGQVKVIRDILDKNGFTDLPIMAYSAKFTSSFYSPFREAAQSSPKFGNRKSYQMDYHNLNEALREIELDIQEGADIVMVKPTLCYLDVIAKAKEKFNVPIAAYNVSGEYSLIKAASQKGWIDEKQMVLEILTAIKRAGADIIISYYTKDVAKWLE